MPGVKLSLGPAGLNVRQTSLIREHLQQVLTSCAFDGSKRAQDFLQLIVEHVLAGRTDALRERMIGAEMFGRPVNYDTANDAVVRVKATEVRRKLAQYYSELDSVSPVRIVLPVGSYVPQFSWNVPPPEEEVHVALSRLENAVVPPLTPSRLLPPLRTIAFAAFGVLLLALIALFVWGRWRDSLVIRPIRSIAILPLLNLSADPHQEYFADGMTEELTTEMSRISSLRVISRTSSMTYKGTRKTLPEIARELQVDSIVEGSVEREGNRVRINTQLIDSRTDQHIWAHSYDRDMTSVLELESAVARAITDQIRVELTPEEKSHLTRSWHVPPQAVEVYLQGTQKKNAGDTKAAVALLRKATELAPGYAAAHAALASTYGWMGEAGWMSYPEAFSLERTEALKAIELDEALPEPHLDLGLAAVNQGWDWNTQQKEFQRALALNPNAATVHWAYAVYLGRVGREDDALAEAKRALALDPVSSSAHANMCYAYYYAHQYDQAAAQVQLGVAEHSRLFLSGLLQAARGQYNLAVLYFKQLGDAPHAVGHMGNALARAGHTAEALATTAVLQRHITEHDIGRYEIALVYAGLKDYDKAFEWLDKALQVRDKGMTYLLIDPCVDPLRSDPRFAALVQRVGFPQKAVL